MLKYMCIKMHGSKSFNKYFIILLILFNFHVANAQHCNFDELYSLSNEIVTYIEELVPKSNEEKQTRCGYFKTSFYDLENQINACDEMKKKDDVKQVNIAKILYYSAEYYCKKYHSFEYIKSCFSTIVLNCVDFEGVTVDKYMCSDEFFHKCIVQNSQKYCNVIDKINISGTLHDFKEFICSKVKIRADNTKSTKGKLKIAPLYYYIFCMILLLIF